MGHKLKKNIMVMTMRRLILIHSCLILGISLQFSCTKISTSSQGIDSMNMWLQSGGLSEHTIDVKNLDPISPVDRIMTQEDHLDLWRAIRTVEVVADHHKGDNDLRDIISIYTQQILEPLSLAVPKLVSTQKEHFWVRKSGSPLDCILSSFFDITKAYSLPETHSEIDHVEEEIRKGFQTTSNPKWSQFSRYNSFMDFSLSKINFYLLLRGIVKEKNQEYSLDSGRLRKEILRKVSELGIDGVQYGSWCRQYMHILEAFEELVSMGLQDREVMLGLTPSKCNTHPGSKVLHSLVEDRWNGQRYGINKDSSFDPQVKPIFLLEDPLKNIQLLGNIGHKARELWALFNQPDLKIAKELVSTNKNHQDNSIGIPEGVKSMSGYIKLLEKVGEDNSQFQHINAHISRCLGLVLKVEADDSEEQLILWKILDSVFNATSTPHQINKFERRIANGLMFYLMIRRFGKVMESILSMETSQEPVTKAQCMQYYWYLLTYRDSKIELHPEASDELADFKLGSIYTDYLISLDQLNQFYYKMDDHIKQINFPQSPDISSHQHAPSLGIVAQKSDSLPSPSDKMSIKQFLEVEGRSKPEKLKAWEKMNERSMIQKLERKLTVPKIKLKCVQSLYDNVKTESMDEGIGNSVNIESSSSFENHTNTPGNGTKGSIKDLNIHFPNEFTKKPRKNKAVDVLPPENAVYFPTGFRKKPRTKKTVHNSPKDYPVDASAGTLKEEISHVKEGSSTEIAQTTSNDAADFTPAVVHQTTKIPGFSSKKDIAV
ncbi:hypothetical protein DFH28DRAFT_426079 [Melampsora americana]|nr:hypothetical protein DFH28DRAFT_426079 [Melampsora americana]